jgi:hypothetical protein
MSGPSHGRYSHFRCELAVIRDVHRRNWTVTAVTTESAKVVEDIQVMSPYIHYENGEGFSHLPEPGAQCFLAWPNDNTSPFIMGYIGVPSGRTSEDAQPIRSGEDTEGSDQDVSYASRRIDLNPGDIMLATRDENFVIMRRGGVLQIGATNLSQRFYIPLQNYIKDFCENYSMTTLGSVEELTVDRPETAGVGKPTVRNRFLLRQYADDAQATVEISNFADDDTAWKVVVAPQSISTEEGSQERSTEVFSLRVDISGSVTQVSGTMQQTINGDLNLSVSGNRALDITGSDVISAETIKYLANGEAVFGGFKTNLGGEFATEPVTLANQLLALLQAPDAFIITDAVSATGGPVEGMVGLNPAKVAVFKAKVASKKVFSK